VNKVAFLAFFAMPERENSYGPATHAAKHVPFSPSEFFNDYVALGHIKSPNNFEGMAL
jgi:hypothetical protein